MRAALSEPEFMTIEDYFGGRYESELESVELEYVDGRLEQRFTGTLSHSLAMGAVGMWFHEHGREWDVHALMSYWVKTTPTRVRDVDVVVVRRSDAEEDVRISPPLLCVEILSPEDRPDAVSRRLDEFVRMGAENLWILNPADRSAAIYTEAGLKLVEDGYLRVAGSPIYLDVAALFASLDEG